MYAIVFDLDTERLQRHYPSEHWQNAYHDIARVLDDFGFHRQQGSVYFGNAKVTDSVKAVLAVQAIDAKYDWFGACVTDIRMLRIEDNNDLGPALKERELPLSPRTAAE